jgi:hypothetical protein
MVGFNFQRSIADSSIPVNLSLLTFVGQIAHSTSLRTPAPRLNRKLLPGYDYIMGTSLTFHVVAWILSHKTTRKNEDNSQESMRNCRTWQQFDNVITKETRISDKN